MPSFLAIYRASVEEVLRQWNDAADDLGFDVLQSLTHGGAPNGCWRLNGNGLYVDVRLLQDFPDGERSVWVDLYGGSYEEFTELFPRVLALPLKAVEVLVCLDKDLDDNYACYLLKELTPEQIIEACEASQLPFAGSSLRAFHRSLMEDPKRWRAEALERGLGWEDVGEYGVLDVHWELRGSDCPERDSLTGLADEGAIFDIWPLDPDPPHLASGSEPDPPRALTGAFFLVNLTQVVPNPERAYEPWPKVSIKAARVLETWADRNDFALGRFHTRRRFGLIRGDVSREEALVYLWALRDEMTHAFAEDERRPRGQIFTLHWPEDGATQSELWDRLGELERAESGTAFGPP